MKNLKPGFMQIMINDMAHRKVKRFEDQDERAKMPKAIRYESRLDAYQFLLGKFENFKAGKSSMILPRRFVVRNYYV